MTPELLHIRLGQTHYRPHGRVIVCRLRDHLLKDDGQLNPEVARAKQTTDVSRVSCPECCTWIRDHLRY